MTGVTEVPGDRSTIVQVRGIPGTVARTSTQLFTRLNAAFGPGTVLRRRAANIGHMLSGNAASALFAIISLSMAMRSLGPEQAGLLALVISYARLIERITRFESWQPLIKYAATIKGPDSAQDLRQLYGFGLRLDIIACLVAALLAVALALVGNALFGLSGESVTLILIYSIALLFNVTGMPTAVLRMSGRFKTIAYVQASGNLLRIGVCYYGLVNDSPLAFFAFAWAGCQVFAVALLLLLASLDLRRQRVGNPLTVSCSGVTRRFPGIMGFAWSSNLSMTIRSSANDFDVLVVGWFADPASAGLYYFAKRFAKAVQQLNAQVQAVLYPDVARLWADGAYSAFAKLTAQIQKLLAGCFVVLFLLVLAFGHLIIRYGPGEQFSGALPMLLIQIIAVGLSTHAAPSRTALLAMGRATSILNIVLIGTIVFQIVMFTLVPWFGAMGANAAHVVLALICAIGFDTVVRRELKQVRADDGPDVQRSEKR